MSVTYLNYSASGTEITDEPIVINTAGSQQLVHDHIMSIEVWTGEGKTGSQLVASTDYVLGDYDSFYKTYNTITFLTHNGETVYSTYLTKGDKNSADDVNSKADKLSEYANSIRGNPTGSVANVSDIPIAANQLLARSSSGNLAPKSITDFGLGLIAAADAAAGRTALGSIASSALVQTIRNGYTTSFPSEDAVYDGLAAKLSLNTAFTEINHYYNLASAYFGISTGILKIGLPFGLTGTTCMFELRISGFKYRATFDDLDQDQLDIRVHCYIGYGNVYSRRAYVVCGSKLITNPDDVRLGYDSVNDKFYILIGNVSALWSYSRVVIPEVYSPSARSYFEGITFSITTDISDLSITLLNTVIYSAAKNPIFSGVISHALNQDSFVTCTDLKNISEGSNVGYDFTINTGLNAANKRGFSIGVLGAFNTGYSSYGSAGYAYFRSAGYTPGLNFIVPKAEGIFNLFAGHSAASQAELTAISGKVGILKSSPTEPLHVGGNIKTEGYVEFNEISIPSAGAADTLRVLAVDNGGLTELHVRAYGESAQKIPFCARENSYSKTQGFAMVDNGNSGTSKTIDWRAGNKQKLTLTGDCTISFTDPSESTGLTLILIQDGTGNRVITWNGMTIRWAGDGAVPVLSTAANSHDLVMFVYDASADLYYGSYSSNHAVAS
jgi:hypothetical protein